MVDGTSRAPEIGSQSIDGDLLRRNYLILLDDEIVPSISFEEVFLDKVAVLLRAIGVGKVYLEPWLIVNGT